MKKMVFLVVVIYLLVLMVPSSYAKSNNCYETIYPINLNSNDLFSDDYLITSICTKEYCYYSKYYDNQKNIAHFKEQYLLNVLDVYQTSEILKGINIKSITYYKC